MIRSREERQDAAVRQMSDIERKAHARIARILWVIFPNDENMNSEQGESDHDKSMAAIIIDGLKRDGLTFSELDREYNSPMDMTDEELEVFHAELEAKYGARMQ